MVGTTPDKSSSTTGPRDRYGAVPSPMVLMVRLAPSPLVAAAADLPAWVATREASAATYLAKAKKEYGSSQPKKLLNQLSDKLKSSHGG